MRIYIRKQIVFWYLKQKEFNIIFPEFEIYYKVSILLVCETWQLNQLKIRLFEILYFQTCSLFLITSNVGLINR